MKKTIRRQRYLVIRSQPNGHATAEDTLFTMKNEAAGAKENLTFCVEATEPASARERARL